MRLFGSLGKWFAEPVTPPPPVVEAPLPPEVESWDSVRGRQFIRKMLPGVTAERVEEKVAELQAKVAELQAKAAAVLAAERRYADTYRSSWWSPGDALWTLRMVESDREAVDQKRAANESKARRETLLALYKESGELEISVFADWLTERVVSGHPLPSVR